MNAVRVFAVIVAVVLLWRRLDDRGEIVPILGMMCGGTISVTGRTLRRSR